MAIVLPAIVAGARYHVGTDWDNYNYNFTLIRSLTFDGILQHKLLSNSEIGFKIVVKILSFIGNNELIFFFFALMTIVFVADTLLKEYVEYDITISYFMFLFVYFSNSFNIMRQTLAVAIVFWGMRKIYNGKFIEYFIIIICATMIHFTAIVAIPIYFLWNKRKSRTIKNKFFIPFFCVVGVMVLFWRQILGVVQKLGSPFIAKYLIYLENNNARNRDFYVKVLFFLSIFLLYNVTKIKDEKMKLFLQMGSINLLIATTGFYITFFKRLGLYYEMPAIILVGAINKLFESKSRVLINVFLEFLIILYFILVFHVIGDSQIIPYQIRL